MLRYHERLGECLGDVFPDEMPQRADAPELLGGVEIDAGCRRPQALRSRRFRCTPQDAFQSLWHDYPRAQCYAFMFPNPRNS